MKGFIEITEKTDNSKRLLAVDKIIDVEQVSDNTAFISTWINNDGDVLGVSTVETYDEIKTKIILAR